MSMHFYITNISTCYCSLVFLELFRQYKRNGRVLLPLLFTMDKLLSHGYLDELICAQNGIFIRHLITCLANEANGCSDVKRLLAIVGVSLALLRPHLETMDTVRLMCAPNFPRKHPLSLLTLFLAAFWYSFMIDEKRDSPIRYDYAAQPVSSCQTIYRRTSICQAC